MAYLHHLKESYLALSVPKDFKSVNKDLMSAYLREQQIISMSYQERVIPPIQITPRTTTP